MVAGHPRHRGADRASQLGTFPKRRPRGGLPRVERAGTALETLATTHKQGKLAITIA
jgi:hypothetical protein